MLDVYPARERLWSHKTSIILVTFVEKGRNMSRISRSCAPNPPVTIWSAHSCTRRSSGRPLAFLVSSSAWFGESEPLLDESLTAESIMENTEGGMALGCGPVQSLLYTGYPPFHYILKPVPNPVSPPLPPTSCFLSSGSPDSVLSFS